MSWYEYPPYVPAAERRRRGAREVQKRAKKGLAVEPVAIAGRVIARTFWGKAWCDHLEGYSDYANRLPRGRTYVRNGSVVHLGVAPGRIDALDIGTASVSVAALVFGIVMGVKAEQDRPPSPFITGRNGTYSDLADRQANAHQEAIMADVGFGLAAVAAAATAVLFFTRTHTVGPAAGGAGSTSVSAAPLTGGAALFVQGSF